MNCKTCGNKLKGKKGFEHDLPLEIEEAMQTCTTCYKEEIYQKVCKNET